MNYMENDEKLLSPEENLRLIGQMISLAKHSILDKGFHYLLWGCLICIASTADYILLKAGRVHTHYYVWFILPVVGILISVWYNYVHYSKTKSHLGSIINSLWVGFLFTGLLVFANGILGDPTAILRDFMLLMGFAIFVSGSIIRFRALIIGGIVYWLAGLACMFLAYPEQLLANALAALLGSVVPGILLKLKFGRNV